MPRDITNRAIPARIHIPPNQLSIGEQVPLVVAEVIASSVPVDGVIILVVEHPYSITEVNTIVKYLNIKFLSLIPSMGLEPILPNGKQILSLSRLPVPPQGQSTPSRIRTYDPRLRRPLLCPLSYRSIRACPPALGLSPCRSSSHTLNRPARIRTGD